MTSSAMGGLCLGSARPWGDGGYEIPWRTSHRTSGGARTFALFTSLALRHAADTSLSGHSGPLAHILGAAIVFGASHAHVHDAHRY
jgi:hypothetical protein